MLAILGGLMLLVDVLLGDAITHKLIERGAIFTHPKLV